MGALSRISTARNSSADSARICLICASRSASVGLVTSSGPRIHPLLSCPNPSTAAQAFALQLAPFDGEVDEKPAHASTCCRLLEIHATGLFRTFASTAPTKSGVLGFANEYGLLGTEQYLDPHPHDVPNPIVEGQVVGERLSDWFDHILVMKDVVEVWDLAAKRDEDGLRKIERSRKLFTEPTSHRLAERAAVEPQHDAYTSDGYDFRDDYYHAGPSGSLLRDA